MMELVTPTGAALLRALIQEKGLPSARSLPCVCSISATVPEAVILKNFPNALRLSIGDANETSHEHSGPHYYRFDKQSIQ